MTRPSAIVTGASRGIGRATALELAARGLDLGLLGRRTPALDETAELVRERGARAEIARCDVADASALEGAVVALLARLGTPSVVVNNAGTIDRGPKVHETALESWDYVLAVNLRAPFVLTRALLPAMLAAGRGRFIHVASVSSTIASPEAASYAASKWGLLGFSKSLAEELRGTGLLSIAVLPGSVDTDMLKQSSFAPAMTPTEVASLIGYYALEAPPACNGAAVEMFG
ncbi:MAG: SDR family oxidoreductase [Polyangiaceae bacterium]|nr:SDR family oxidoreductase [Polyangiaceae bacterium]